MTCFWKEKKILVCDQIFTVSAKWNYWNWNNFSWRNYLQTHPDCFSFHPISNQIYKTQNLSFSPSAYNSFKPDDGDNHKLGFDINFGLFFLCVNCSLKVWELTEQVSKIDNHTSRQLRLRNLWNFHPSKFFYVSAISSKRINFKLLHFYSNKLLFIFSKLQLKTKIIHNRWILFMIITLTFVYQFSNLKILRNY